MSLVDWKKIFRNEFGVKVDFSVLEIPEKELDSIVDNIAQLTFFDLIVDVEWIDKIKKYRISLLKNDFHVTGTVLEEILCETAEQVVENVSELVKRRHRQRLLELAEKNRPPQSWYDEECDF